MHAEVGAYAAQAGIERVLATGALSINTVRECSAAGGDAEHFDSQALLIESLSQELEPATVVLVKGSRSAAMEKVVEAIMADTTTQKEVQ